MEEHRIGPSRNLDLVRSFYAALERDDFAGIAEWVAPEIELVLADGPEPGSRVGLTAIEEVWREYLSMWEGYSLTMAEYRELDDERILALFLFGGRGKTSGVDLGQLDSQGAAVFHIHDAKMTRIVRYWDRARAFADLGLAAEGPTDSASS